MRGRGRWRACERPWMKGNPSSSWEEEASSASRLRANSQSVRRNRRWDGESVHSGPRLLDTLPEFVSEYASKALVSRGVRVYVGQACDREADSFIERDE